MLKQFILLLVCTSFVMLSSSACSKSNDSEEIKKKAISYTVSVPVAGNSWVVNNPLLNHTMISENGISQWNNPETVIRTWFWVERAGEIHIGVKAQVSKGESKIRFTFENQDIDVDLTNATASKIEIGSFMVSKPGYYFLQAQGIEKTASSFGSFSDILLGGEVTAQPVICVKDDFYWGRRGPSVHLGYKIPEELEDVEWFYNEITVPEGQDVLGSYFMANGFAEGYFGIQVNSETERRILFSVWSPYQTDDPNSIPDEYKIKLLRKGEGVTTGEFGNEGSGGQSYKVYNWKAGNTYKFLLRGHPAEEDDCTDYTAWFYAPEKGKWELIASFRRPKTDTYLKRPHSFLENFMTEMGPVDRMAYYTNQWVIDKNGVWYELNEATFTADATARKDARRDYAGGIQNGKFFLRNCGFFSDRVEFDTEYKREKTQTQPDIDFIDLP
ncbi:DUF3472 domain-containing protein [Marinifilum caeruleilacunae]|uniref:DUF3472 domain-containing protein n=1 Tax=Marinifilum caeruleilacunae TaxID=2499076 RepID=A0ABX1WUG6_9BACT|nr:DUF3472 domain-containing protein [Marinifilum caeruleilacunae]NOU59744.1 DUF3472 domain-containing protein [Marinifilum caeruleilacunae]